MKVEPKLQQVPTQYSSSQRIIIVIKPFFLCGQIYHSFHDEVKLYKTHWWKCNGACQHRPPFYGLVKRSMNRAPGPNDNWWAAHQASCNGSFIKIREPENYGVKKKKEGSAGKSSGPGKLFLISVQINI